MTSVLFNNPDEFFDELKKDRRKVFRKFVRVSMVKTRTGDFANLKIVGTALIDNIVVKLETIIGEFFLLDEQGAERIRLAAQAKSKEVAGKIAALHLEVRRGIYQ